MSFMRTVGNFLLLALALGNSRGEGETIKCDPEIDVEGLSTAGPQQKLMEEGYARIINEGESASIEILCGQVLCGDHPGTEKARRRMTDQKEALLTPGYKTYGHARKMRRRSSGQNILGISGTCGSNITGMVTVIANERIPTGHTPSYGELYNMVEVMCHEMAHTNDSLGFKSDLHSADAEKSNERFIRKDVMPGLERMLRAWAKQLRDEERTERHQANPTKNRPASLTRGTYGSNGVKE